VLSGALLASSAHAMSAALFSFAIASALSTAFTAISLDYGVAPSSLRFSQASKDSLRPSLVATGRLLAGTGTSSA
jgi:hypothetical protein